MKVPSLKNWWDKKFPKPVCPHFCSTDVPWFECEKYTCPAKEK